MSSWVHPRCEVPRAKSQKPWSRHADLDLVDSHKKPRKTRAWAELNGAASSLEHTRKATLDQEARAMMLPTFRFRSWSVSFPSCRKRRLDGKGSQGRWAREQRPFEWAESAVQRTRSQNRDGDGDGTLLGVIWGGSEGGERERLRARRGVGKRGSRHSVSG